MILYSKLKRQNEVRKEKKMVDFAVTTFVQIIEISLPIAIVFEFGNLIVCTFLRNAFGGRLWFGK